MRLDRNMHQGIQFPFQPLSSQSQLSDLSNLYVLAVLYALQSGEHRLHILYLPHNILAGLRSIEGHDYPQAERTDQRTDGHGRRTLRVFHSPCVGSIYPFPYLLLQRELPYKGLQPPLGFLFPSGFGFFRTFHFLPHTLSSLNPCSPMFSSW